MMKTAKYIAIFLLVSHFAASAQPIQLHPNNPHYFLWRGLPTVLVTSCEHYGSLINMDFDFEKYLNRLKALGLNHTRIFLGDYMEAPDDFCIHVNPLAPAPGRFIAPWARSKVPGFARGGSKFDLDRWDENYFKRLHRYFQLAERNGIVVEVVFFFVGMNWKTAPLHPDNNVNATTPFASQAEYMCLDSGNLLVRQDAYVRKLVRELNRYNNVIFNVANEPWWGNQAHPGFVSPPPAATKAWIQRVSEWIVDEEQHLPKQHLISVDYCNGGERIPEEELESYYRHISVFNTHYDKRAELVRLNYDYPRAFAYNETGFLPVYHSEGYRIHGWRFLFSGGALYNNLDYTYQVGAEDGTRIAEFSCEYYVGCGNPDIKFQMRYLLDFMNRLNFIKMKPDRNVLVIDAFEQDIWPLVWEGRQYAFYIEKGHQLLLRLLVPPGWYEAEWYDPKTGQIVKTEKVKRTEFDLRLQSPVYVTDIALLVTRLEEGQ